MRTVNCIMCCTKVRSAKQVTLNMFQKTVGVVKRVLPITVWLPEYNVEKGLPDFIAGVTCGLTLIPQCIAYGEFAGLQPQYGLYSALFGGVVYALFGTVPELSIAPSVLLSLLTLTYAGEASFGAVRATMLLSFFAGLIEVFCGLLRLGFLVNFVSSPAVAGLTSAAAVLIASAQLQDLFGLPGRPAWDFVETWKSVYENMHNISVWDAALGISCCFFLLVLDKLQSYGISPVSERCNDEKQTYRKFKIFLWFLCVSRSVLVVLCSSILSYLFSHKDQYLFSVTGDIDAGLPKLSLPPFEIVENNRTLTLLDMTKELGAGIIVIPFITILSNVAVAKSFSNGKVLDASQEMLAVGLCNIAGSFVGSIPVHGSFSRSAITNACGVRTPFTGIYISIMVVFALTFLTPFFAYIPKCSLAAVIISAVIFMVKITTLREIWKLNKIDILPFFGTFFACLFLGFEIGIVVGVAIDILLLLFYISRPQIDVGTITLQGNEYIKVTPAASVYYPSAEFFRNRIIQNKINIDGYKNGNVVIIDCSKLTKADFTAATCMGLLADDLQKSNKTIAFLKLERDLLKLLSKTCHNCIFAYTDDALGEILKEREYYDIFDGVQNVKLGYENISKDLQITVSKL